MNRPENRSWPRYEVLAGFVITAALLFLIAWLLAHSLLRGIQPTEEAIDAVRQTLIPDLREYLKPEPLERWLFILLTLVSPLCVFIGLRVARVILGYFAGLNKTGAKRGFALAG